VVDETSLMGDALAMSKEAVAAGDEPYGAVVSSESGTVADRNRVVTANDPTAHSEVMAIRSAARAWGSPALAGSTMVTSFEPCPMCLGAIMEAGITRLVIGTRRTVGEAPLGHYTVERLLDLMDRGADITVATGPLASEMAAFYAAVFREAS